MRINKLTVALLLLSLSVGASFSQSLAELARKEKERREKLKGKRAKVVTNADLKKIKIRPAIEVRVSMLPEPNAPETLTSSSPQATPKQEPEEPAKTEKEERGALKERWEKAQEDVDLLSAQLSALWKQYRSAENMVPKEYLQQQISLTFLQLQKAQQEAAELKRQLDETADKKKE